MGNVTAWNRITREASIASGGKFIAAAIAVALMAAAGPGPVHAHQAALYAWLAAGALPVLLQLGVPWMRANARF